MRRYKKVIVEEEKLVEFNCSVCGMDLLADEMELQETFSFTNFGGYSSVFGDGSMVSIDMCQHCFKRLLGKYCTYE